MKNNILDYLDETAIRLGERIALSGTASSLSFCELRQRARRIASRILSKDDRRRCVAVLMDKHPDTVCAFFGALYAGCFYLCIDPSLPDARIRAIADRARVETVICNRESQKRAEILYGRAEMLSIEDALNIEPDKDLLGRARERIIDTDIAYIVFTSGSTGEPKGVCTSHRALLDYANALCSTLPFDESTVFGNQAPLYYDAPLKELLPVVCLGASLVFISKELFMFPAMLCNFTREKGINTLCWAASAFSVISSLGALEKCDMSHIRLVCFGSEPFPMKEYKKWRTACPRATFVNLYGPTEATGMSTYYFCGRELEDDEPIPIGKPFPNTEILLIGEGGEECREGEIGEIYIRGSCLSFGYFGDARATAAAFVQNPRNRLYPETVYRTGDLARYNSRGELVYLGRRDRQIKIMGRRIEPYEIERAACECKGVLMTALCHDPERNIMELFYTGNANEKTIEDLLSSRLPRFMLPRRCVQLDRMPQKENGKLDRALLESFIKQKKEDDLFEKA
ncbi:MAG: amino acid adenylation domain-containing protein [Clostridia bacterium]|nr:amino acid adenylation domain-containing protein [Clostridia bacterium]